MFSDYIYGSTAHSEYYACKVTGASHLRSEMTCQDAYEVVCLADDEKVTFLAVADGHGSEKHDLSEHGSRLAAKAAVQIMQELHHKFGTMPRELTRSFKQDFPRLVVRRWQRFVKEDAVSRSIPVPEDLDGIRALYSRYGTTLLAAMCMPQAVLLGQIGDGNIVFIDSEGRVEVPFAETSDELIGNATYSMSSEQAHLLWSTAQRTVDAKPTLFLMSTDGLANSFESDPSYQAFARSLLENIRAKSVHAYRDYFPEMLSDFTSRGSGDDITIAIHYYGEPEIDTSHGVEEGE